MKKSIYFLKKLTAAEVGLKGTHEIYVRLPNDFDYEAFFPSMARENGSVIQVDFFATNTTHGHSNKQQTSLKFVYYVNSNKEKRIPSLGDFFSSNDVQEGDVVCLESRQENDQIKFFISFTKAIFANLNPAAVTYSILQDDSSCLNSGNSLDVDLQQIYYGAPGTGKSHEIKKNLSKVSKDFIFRTTFHPDSDYSTFVGAYKPTMKRNYKYEGKVKATYYEDDDLAGAKKGDKIIEERIEYRFIPQAFMNAYIQAYKHPEEKIYLIIEEINRGNCAQIFGDLFQLLDRDDEGKSEYPIKADSDILSFLKDELGVDSEGIKDGELCLPSNLFIWATMNTSDQSLFPIDSAFKRRWEWKYMPIKYDRTDVNILIGDEKFSWVKFQKIVNEKILSDTSSEDKMLGDYFVNPSNKIITKDILVNKIFFYLWNDVCKDGDSDIFRISETEELSFSELYTNEAKLIALMHKLTDDKDIASQETTQDE